MADHHVIVNHPLAILVPNLDDPVRGGADEDAWLEGVPLQAVHWAVVGLLVGFGLLCHIIQRSIIRCYQYYQISYLKCVDVGGGVLSCAEVHHSFI